MIKVVFSVFESGSTFCVLIMNDRFCWLVPGRLVVAVTGGATLFGGDP